MRHFFRGAPWLPVSMAFLLTSCALTALVPLIPMAHKVPFDESQFVRYRGSGSSGVAGQVVVTGPDGAVHLGAQNHVSLIPVNAYTTELINRSIGDGETLSADARFHQYVRLTKADDQGNFQFSHIPAGEYYVAVWLHGRMRMISITNGLANG